MVGAKLPVVTVGDAGRHHRGLEPGRIGPGVLAPADATPLTHVDQQPHVGAAQRSQERVEIPLVNTDGHDMRHAMNDATATAPSTIPDVQREELRALQTPLKERYKTEPDAARVTLSATGSLGEGVACSVQTGRALAQAGLHPATGGDGSLLCSGDMLLEALVACAGVTLRAVATSLGISVASGQVRAEGDLDFRGTLGVDREALVGFSAIRLSFELETDADAEQLETLRRLTERYCVVYQTLSRSPALSSTLSAA